MDPFVDEMVEASEDFGHLWEKQRVRGKTHEVQRFHHRQVGDLSLEYQALDLPDSAGWQVVIYTPEPGTASAEAFTLLGALAPAFGGDTTGEQEARAARRPRI